MKDDLWQSHSAPAEARETPAAGAPSQASPAAAPAEGQQSKPPFHLGGQALIEGVMMRSPHYVAAAVRRADGSIETRVEPFRSVLEGRPWLRLPLVRGTVALLEMMALGMKFLNWSAQRAMQDDEAKGQTASPAANAVSLRPADGADSAAGPPQP